MQMVVTPKEKVSLLNFVSIREPSIAGGAVISCALRAGGVQATFSTNTMVQSCAAALMDKGDWIKAAAVA